MVATDDERRWILRSQKGDHDAFESLIQSHQHMIHSLAYRMTGSVADAEDLAQETFIQAHQQLENFRGDAKFSSWLYRIAVNRCLNWKKREQRHGQLLEDWHEQSQTSAKPNAGLAGQVQSALMKLNPEQRAAIVLTTYDGLSHAEAAKVFGCSETTVSWRLFAARAKLKRLLRDVKSGVGE